MLKMPEKPINSDQKGPEKSLKTYAQYAGMGFQMLIIIGLFAFLGYQLDEYNKTELPIFTAILSLCGVVIALYQGIKSIIRK